MPGVKLDFNHAMLYTRNVGRSVEFYRSRLGLTLLERQGPYYARLRFPGGRQTLALHRLPPGGRLDARREGARLYFETRELDRFCRVLSNRGVKFVQAPQTMPWGWRHAYLKDPDGHEISLYWAGRKRLNRAEKQ